MCIIAASGKHLQTFDLQVVGIAVVYWFSKDGAGMYQEMKSTELEIIVRSLNREGLVSEHW